MLKPDHKVVIAYTTTNVIGVTTVNVKYPNKISYNMFIYCEVVIFSFYLYCSGIGMPNFLQINKTSCLSFSSNS